MSKKAMLVGINDYDYRPPLSACVHDAKAMEEVLRKHHDGSGNYHCRTYISGGKDPLTRGFLRTKWHSLFDKFDGDALFYFSGHGTPSETGGFLASQDSTAGDPGLPMNEVVTLANKCAARSVLIILDCCFSGAAGNDEVGGRIAELRDGVTILAASQPSQLASEVAGHGVFTELLLGALRGGAADVRGHVSAASMYAYVEQALSPWDARPVYKSHASTLSPVRKCEPKVSDELLRAIPQLFPTEDYAFRLDMTYEVTSDIAIPENVAKFRQLKLLQIAGLLRLDEGHDLFWTAYRSECSHLSALGQFYHRLAARGFL